MLVPDSADLSTQVVDVRDLASWLVDSAVARLTGTYDAVGPAVPFGEWIEQSRAVAGHTGPVVWADPVWLREQGVAEWMGPESLPLWIADPESEGFGARSGSRAAEAGLRHRSRHEMLTDLLEWEREQELERERAAGMSPGRERELLDALGVAG